MSNIPSEFKPFYRDSLHTKPDFDNCVKTAIDAFQHLLFDPKATIKIFPLLLKHIETITDSEFSTILILDSEKDGSVTTGAIGGEPASTILGDSNFVNPSVVREWLATETLAKSPTFFNYSIPDTYKRLLLNADNVSGLMVLPIMTFTQLRGLCIIAKSQGGYSDSMIRRLMPLLGSVVCALQSAHSIKNNILSISSKASDSNLLNSVLSNSLLGILLIDNSGRVVVNNYESHQMFIDACPEKFKGTSLIGKKILSLIPKFEEMSKWSRSHNLASSDLTSTGPQVWGNQSVLRVDGCAFKANITIFTHTQVDQNYSVIQLQNTTHIERRAEEFREATQKLSALMHLAPVAIIQVDANWNCVFANDKWYEFTGLTDAENQGNEWINALHKDDVEEILKLLRKAIIDGSELKTELRLVSPLGSTLSMDLNVKTLFDDNGITQGFLATFADITERLMTQDRLRHIAQYDELTGLANRSLLNERLSESVSNASSECAEIAVFFIDLDGFKDINDTLGHDVGDKLLQRVAARILNALRAGDTVARFGGDEFVVLIPSMRDFSEVTTLAERVVNVVGNAYSIDGHDIYVTTSLGIAVGEAGSTTPAHILKQADTALYFAKSQGKNNYRVFNDDLNNKANIRVQLTHQLKTGLVKERFYLTYQPQAKAADEQLVGFEALIRFIDNQGAVVSPEQFIPVLEESGMIIEVGSWVIQEACRQLRQWMDEGLFPDRGYMAINVSPKQLLDDSVLTVLSSACDKYRIDPAQLVIELTESVLIDRPEKVRAMLGKLKAFGVRLSLDDFGTGYSSLVYLQNYPFDHIKIDRSFIQNLPNDENDQKITKSIIALAHSLNLSITAEGVEDENTLRFLRQHGANYYQGYLLGRPMKADEAASMMGVSASFNDDSKRRHLASA